LRFWDKYPELIELAHKKYGAVVESDGQKFFCPEFVSKDDMFEWVGDITNLTQGKVKLLRLYTGV